MSLNQNLGAPNLISTSYGPLETDGWIGIGYVFRRFLTSQNEANAPTKTKKPAKIARFETGNCEEDLPKLIDI